MKKEQLLSIYRPVSPEITNNCRGFTLTREGQITPLFKDLRNKPNWPSSCNNKTCDIEYGKNTNNMKLIINNNSNIKYSKETKMIRNLHDFKNILVQMPNI